jgi:hypothetical protein
MFDTESITIALVDCVSVNDITTFIENLRYD